MIRRPGKLTSRLAFIRRRQKAAAADLAYSNWERKYGDAVGGRLRGRFVPKKPEPGVWPESPRRVQ